jgi:symplekin
MVKSFLRILNSERSAAVGGIADIRYKIITALVSNNPAVLSSALLSHIVEDLPKRIELALAWLYEEYCCCHSFHKVKTYYKINACIFSNTFVVVRTQSLQSNNSFYMHGN